MKISLHRALAELKLMDAKIEKIILEIEPNGLKQKGKLVNGHYEEEDFGKQAKSKFQAVTDLIDRKVKIKAAVVKANAETVVKIGEREMTIADAITYKTIIAYKKSLIDNLKSKFARAKKEMESKNMLVEQNLQKVLEATFGKDNVKITKEDVDAVRKPFLDSNEWVLVDPLKVEATLEKMEQEMAEFETEVDAVLSETNAITLIEI